MATVKIIVTESGSGSNKGISVSVDPFQLDLASQPTPVDIDWDLDNTNASQWLFSRKGIEVKAPANVFQDNGGSGMGKKHGWKRKQKDNRKYKYSINLENATDGTALTWDPFIVNN